MSARILVVDDTPVNVRLLEAKLTAEYFDVLTAHDGPSALEVAEREVPDVILLDVMMPGMDGFEVCRRLRENPALGHIPVVMITALTDVSDRVRGLEAGADDFLSKPVNDIALFARVRSLVRLKTLMDELRARQAAAGVSVDDRIQMGAMDDLEGARVLLVDGQKQHGQRVSDKLRAAGYDVTLSQTLPEAQQQSFVAPYFDLIIAGIEVAGEDGLRFCSQLRSHEETRHIPILLVLDDMDLPRLAKGLDLGVTDYLFKPVDNNELLARVRTQVRRTHYHNRLRSMLDQGMSMAYTDSLTGTYNRRYMNSYLERKLPEIKETGKPLALLIFDIDHFKEVNDTHGHGVGDKILREVCRRVSDNVRDFDLLSRFGGEEFVLIMPNTTTEQAMSIAERLREQIGCFAVEIDEEVGEQTVTVSIGVSVTIDPNTKPSTLLEEADHALYEAKRGGRNRVVMSETVAG
ncbi:PleD family two-component system response regulator [Fodinicurvata fenggangensis]|uniref:PleD family two-component system response regulator n=1 Tax=Fodinicurvata fenggangensis TaxID=1121830 RepID=UPI00047C1BEA|nr:PleD family two-component system response regulator [Fodinicurvata fenggangensis]